VIYKAHKRTKSQDYQNSTWVNYYTANTQDSRWAAATYLTFKGTLFPEECGLSHWLWAVNGQLPFTSSSWQKLGLLAYTNRPIKKNRCKKPQN